MATSSGQSTSRKVPLAALMVAILAASVGVAWLLQVSSARHARAAAEILRQIRARGLSHYWGQDDSIDWYLIYSSSAVQGWQAVIRERTPEGNFRGLSTVVTVDPRTRSQTRKTANWILNPDATIGRYEGLVTTGRLEKSRTSILLRKDEVLVQQGPGQPTARSPAPANYIPEGTLGLAIREVAARGGQAQFKMVFDEVPRIGNEVQFTAVRLRHIGRGQTGAGKPTDRVRLSHREWGKYEQIYELDETGSVLTIEPPDGLRLELASPAEVAQHFPTAAAEVRSLLGRPAGPEPEDFWRKLFGGRL